MLVVQLHPCIVTESWSGRKKCTSNRDNCSFERIVKQNPFKNLEELHKEGTETGVDESRATMHRRILDMGYRCRIHPGRVERHRIHLAGSPV